MKPIHKIRKMLEMKYQRQASELGMIPGLHLIVKLAFEMPLLKRFGLENGFILNVGGIHERKNIVRLIHAFSRLVKQKGFKGKLLIKLPILSTCP